MKLKNHYIWLCAIWIFFTIINAVNSVVHFTNGNIGKGFISLVLSIAFSFVSGVLLKNAINIAKYNQYLQRWEEKLKEIEARKKSVQEKPFAEFDVPFPDVKD